MKLRILALLAIVFSFSSAYLSFAAQESTSARRREQSALTPSVKISTEQRKAAERALERLRVLRDGWNDVNRQYIRPGFVMGRKLDARDYEVQYLEAKSDVAAALEVIHRGELHTAIKQAMELFDDLEEIKKIFDKTAPLSTNVRVSDIFIYLKKYNVPYESGINRTSYSLTLHQDFVMSYILPLRYVRVNRVEVLLGGKVKPIPPPPTYEQMFRVPAPKPPIDRSSISVDALKGIIRQAIEARVRGNQTLMTQK